MSTTSCWQAPKGFSLMYRAWTGSLRQMSGQLSQSESAIASNKFQEDVALVALLTACARHKDLYKGSRVHVDILSKGSLQKNIFVGNALVNMYAKCGALAQAQQVFDDLPVRDAVSWNALIAGYTQYGHGEEALNRFEWMKYEGCLPDAVTFACLLKACGSVGAAEKGEEIHAEVVLEGLLREDCVLGSALVDMYARCGALLKAQKLFNQLPVRNVVSWNGLIAGFSQHGHSQQALNCLEQMQLEGVFPDAVTFLCILKACGSIGAAEKGEKLHAMIERQGLVEKDSVLGTALVDMYGKCGALMKAQRVFDELTVRNVVSWNALIAGYLQYGHDKVALDCFERMQHEGLSPDGVTFACISKAYGSIGAAEKGNRIHAEIIREGLLVRDSVLGVALVDMYAKSGALMKAQQVFDELYVQDVVSWNTLLAGYAQYGHGIEALNSFAQMQHEGLSPDHVTFLCMLSACSCSGLVDEGQRYFNAMRTTHGIIPTLEHRTCMVDLFGRGGQFGKAMEVITKFPCSDSLPLWFALLGSCRKWGNVNLGRLAFERAVQMDEKSAMVYVYMSNIYADAGMQEDADKIEVMRIRNEAWKLPGCCWSNVSGIVYSFSVGDKRHFHSKFISAKVEDIAHRILQKGYCPDLQLVLQDMTSDAKKDLLCGHDEK